VQIIISGVRMEIIIPSIEEIIDINKQLGGGVINRGNLEFLISKIESKYKDKDFKKQVAKIAAIIWMHIIEQHPFTDGNKRTATETMLLFLEKNDYYLDCPVAGKVYLSLKIANHEIEYDTLISWIYGRLKEVKK